VANWIEAAKTSRSKCVTCGNVIEKGTPRLSEETREIRIPTLIHRYYHLRCALAVVPDVLRPSTPCAAASRSSPTSRPSSTNSS
jgi:ferredoxin